jgi:hypothetical protein
MRTTLLLAVAVSALGVAGCGDGDTAATGTTTAPPPPPTATVPVETTTAPPPAPTPPATPKPKQIVIVVDQGQPRGGIKRPKIDKGDKLVLVIRSDAGEEVHVHGYDVERKLKPGTPLRIPITASIPGRFEVELHEPDVLLAVLEVQP